MAAVLQFQTALESIECWDCGVTFGAPGNMIRHRREKGGSVHCPNGHENFWNDTEVKKLRRKVEEKEKEIERQRLWRRQAEDRQKEEERSHAATKGHLTRYRKRTAHGVCPCCSRTFKQLAKHMKTQHPEYVKDNG